MKVLFVNLTITFELFLLILLQGLIRSGGTWQSSLPKMLRTFSSKTSAPTSLGMPITSKHSLLEYWAFSQHWRFILVNPFDESECNCRETDNSDWTLKIASDNLQISSSTCLLGSSSLLCKDSTILTMSLLFIFSNDSFVHVAIFKPKSYKLEKLVPKWKLKYYSTINCVRMLRCSLMKSEFSDPLKLSNIVSGHKKEDLTDKANYRYVSVLPLLSRVFEKVMCEQLLFINTWIITWMTYVDFAR